MDAKYNNRLSQYYKNRILKINNFCPVCGKPLTRPDAKGCQKHFSQETRDRMSKFRLGKKRSKEIREKLRLGKLGKKNPGWGKFGEKNSNWKGGSKNNFNFYYQTNWAVLRKKIYKRDKWTCQSCGVHCQSKGSPRIQCHHIVPYGVSQDNSAKNLVTLCVSCHRMREKEFCKKYGIQIKMF